MVVSSMRRNAPADEIQFRKRAYDEAYVDWNKNILLNLFVIREVGGDMKFAGLEKSFEDDLVASMADVDRCLTKAYDRKLAGEDVAPILDACRMPQLHQFILDCGATFTDELYKLTRLSFSPFSNAKAERKRLAEINIKANCTRPPEPASDNGTAHRHAGAQRAAAFRTTGCDTSSADPTKALSEQLAYAGAHLFERKGLRQHCHVRALQRLGAVELLGKARHQQHTQVRLLQRALRQGDAVEQRHLDVAHQHVELLGARPFDAVERFAAVLRDVHAMAVRLQRPPDEIAGRRVVIGKQYPGHRRPLLGYCRTTRPTNGSSR